MSIVDVIAEQAERIATLPERPPMTSRDALAQVAATGHDDVRDVALSRLLEIRSPRLADMPWLRNSFAEGHKDAPGVNGMSWRHYKRWIVPELHAALAGAELIAAYLGPDIVGWIALTRGKRADTVHWIHTRYRVGLDGEVLRRRKIATALLDAAQLKQHLAYTFRGAQPKHREHAGAPMDERLLPWLRARGHHAAYVPWEEWNQ